jgi:hypothetical protein
VKGIETVDLPTAWQPDPQAPQAPLSRNRRGLKKIGNKAGGLRWKQTRSWQHDRFFRAAGRKPPRP